MDAIVTHHISVQRDVYAVVDKSKKTQKPTTKEDTSTAGSGQGQTSGTRHQAAPREGLYATVEQGSNASTSDQFGSGQGHHTPGIKHAAGPQGDLYATVEKGSNSRTFEQFGSGQGIQTHETRNAAGPQGNLYPTVAKGPKGSNSGTSGPLGGVTASEETSGDMYATVQKAGKKVKAVKKEKPVVPVKPAFLRKGKCQ
nr:hypothetical protein BaRGS_021957 [Batillaria attramentaria]